MSFLSKLFRLTPGPQTAPLFMKKGGLGGMPTEP